MVSTVFILAVEIQPERFDLVKRITGRTRPSSENRDGFRFKISTP